MRVAVDEIQGLVEHCRRRGGRQPLSTTGGPASVRIVLHEASNHAEQLNEQRSWASRPFGAVMSVRIEAAAGAVPEAASQLDRFGGKS